MYDGNETEGTRLSEGRRVVLTRCDLPGPETTPGRQDAVRTPQSAAERRDVLVQLEDVARVVALLEADQPVPGRFAVGLPDPVRSFVAQVVDVAAAGRPRPEPLPRRPGPRPVAFPRIGGVRPHGGNGGHGRGAAEA